MGRGTVLGWAQPLEGYQAIVRHAVGSAPGGNEPPAPDPAMAGGPVVRAGNSPPHAIGAFPPSCRPLSW